MLFRSRRLVERLPSLVTAQVLRRCACGDGWLRANCRTGRCCISPCGDNGGLVCNARPGGWAWVTLGACWASGSGGSLQTIQATQASATPRSTPIGGHTDVHSGWVNWTPGNVIRATLENGFRCIGAIGTINPIYSIYPIGAVLAVNTIGTIDTINTVLPISTT